MPPTAAPPDRRRDELAGGVLVIDKPAGPTSHDVVKRLRRLLRTPSVGHAGTLDPMATGVLVVAIGEATKLVPWLSAHDKSYEATIALGVETDTLDAEGRETRRRAPTDATVAALARSRPGAVDEALEVAFRVERERSMQVPPAYSAIRTDGERSFDRARRGEAVELAPRPARLLRIELVACVAEPCTLEVSVDVGKGYYVRALARDLAATLGTVGHLVALRRTRSGCFSLDEAVAPDLPPEELRARLQPLARAAARALPVVRLTEAGAREARHGRVVRPADMDVTTPGPSAWLAPDGDLVAIGALEPDGVGRVIRGMTGPAPSGSAA
jgi:tRNA pseudouridine55 synthase